jgi:hypothetical protein
MAVPAVRRREVVVGRERRADASGDGLLAKRRVDEARDVAIAVQRGVSKARISAMIEKSSRPRAGRGSSRGVVSVLMCLLGVSADCQTIARITTA